MPWPKGYAPRSNQILAILKRNKNKPVTKKYLSQEIYKSVYWKELHRITALMREIRKNHPEYIIESTNPRNKGGEGTYTYKGRHSDQSRRPAPLLSPLYEVVQQGSSREGVRPSSNEDALQEEASYRREHTA